MHRSKGKAAAVALGLLMAGMGPAAAENVLRWSSVGGAATIDPQWL
jgi:hypothetical protein